WSPYAGDAMAELERLEVVGAGLAPAKADSSSQAVVTLDPLLRFVLSDDDYLRYKAEQRQSLQDGLDWISSDVSGAPAEEAGKAFAADSPAARQALDTGVASLTKYWELRLAGGNRR